VVLVIHKSEQLLRECVTGLFLFYFSSIVFIWPSNILTSLTIINIPDWCALWGPSVNCACVLSNSQR